MRLKTVSIGRKLEIWREYPGTYTVAALWCVVYVAMLISQYEGWTPKPDPRAFAGMGPMGIGVVSETTAQVFGAWNAAEILSGQIWRAVTATFVHFSLIHIALNVFGLVQLGRLIEEWYGPRLLIGVLIAVGFFGNMLAALARPVVGSPTSQSLIISSGGGSTIVFGMIGLVAIVGKRSRSRMGRYLYNQMLMLLVVNFLIGLTIPQIDNFAHAGGAIAGAILGRFHHVILGLYDHRPRVCWLVALLALSAVAGGAIGQYWVARVETDLMKELKRRDRIFALGKQVPELRGYYLKRVVLGLKGAQVIRQRGPLRMPMSRDLFIPIPDDVLQENVRRLYGETDKISAMVRELGDASISQSWKPIMTAARLAYIRPPLPSDELQNFMKLTEAFEGTLKASVRTVDDSIRLTASRLILWRMPWFNVVWTPEGPRVKSAMGPPGSALPNAGQAIAKGKSIPADQARQAPTMKPQNVPRPEKAPPNPNDEKEY